MAGSAAPACDVIEYHDRLMSSTKIDIKNPNK